MVQYKILTRDEGELSPKEFWDISTKEYLKIFDVDLKDCDSRMVPHSRICAYFSCSMCSYVCVELDSESEHTPRPVKCGKYEECYYTLQGFCLMVRYRGSFEPEYVAVYKGEYAGDNIRNSMLYEDTIDQIPIVETEQIMIKRAVS